MHRRPAQVEKSVAQAHVLWIVDLAEHRHRQGLGRRQHGERPDAHLDLAGVDLRVHGVGVSGHQFALDGDHTFRADPLHRRKTGIIGLDDALGRAVLVTQIDEEEIAVIPLAVHPA